MARYEVIIGGKPVIVEAPDGASEEHIRALAQRKQSPGAVDRLRALGHGLTKGGLMNFGDEISGAVVPLIPHSRQDLPSVWRGDDYGEARATVTDRYRREEAESAQVAPGTFLTGEIGSALVGGAAIARGLAKGAARFAPKATTKARTFASKRPRTAALAGGAAGGGVGGAVAGAGAGTTPEERRQGARDGGTIGAVVGGGGGVALGTIAPYAKKYITAAVTGGNSLRIALQQMNAALKKDGFDTSNPDTQRRILEEVNKYSPAAGVTLADISNSVRGRVGTGMRYESAAREPGIQQITDRAQGQGDRITTAIRENVPPPEARRVDAAKVDEELLEELNAIGKDGRDRAFFETREIPGRSRFHVFSEEPRWGGVAREVGYLRDPNLPATEDNLIFRARLKPSPTPTRFRDRAETVHDVDLRSGSGTYRRLEEVGTRGMMQSIRELRRDFPDIEALMGYRVTGARRANSGSRDSEQNPFANSPFIEMSKVKPAPAPPSRGVERTSRMIQDERVKRLLADPQSSASKALKESMELEREDRLRRIAMGENLTELPDLRMEGPYSYETVDRVKQYLDGVINRLERGQPGGGAFNAAEMHNLIRMRNDLRTIMKDTNPEYKEYLEAYGDVADMRKGLEQGVGYRGQTPDEIGARQADASRGGAATYRVGAGRAMTDNVMRTNDAQPGTAVNRFMESPIEQSRLRNMGLSEEEVSNLMNTRTQELDLNRLFREVQSARMTPLARREAEEQASGLPTIQVPYNIGNPVGWFGAAGRGARDALMLKSGSSVNEQLLPMALENTPQGISKIIDDLAKAGKFEEARNLARVMMSANAGHTFGVLNADNTIIPQER